MGWCSAVPDRHLVVVAAVRPGPTAPDVLRTAAREARRRGARVEMVTVWSALDVPDERRLWAAEREARRRAERAQHTALAVVGESELAGVEVTGVLVEGDPGDLLVRASNQAACLVLGAGSAGGAARGTALARAAHCPVRRVASGSAALPTQRAPGRRRDLHHTPRR